MTLTWKGHHALNARHLKLGFIKKSSAIKKLINKFLKFINSMQFLFENCMRKT
jgi:hypothetical protein